MSLNILNDKKVDEYVTAIYSGHLAGPKLFNRILALAFAGKKNGETVSEVQNVWRNACWQNGSWSTTVLRNGTRKPCGISGLSKTIGSLEYRNGLVYRALQQCAVKERKALGIAPMRRSTATVKAAPVEAVPSTEAVPVEAVPSTEAVPVEAIPSIEFKSQIEQIKSIVSDNSLSDTEKISQIYALVM